MVYTTAVTSYDEIHYVMEWIYWKKKMIKRKNLKYANQIVEYSLKKHTSR